MIRGKHPKANLKLSYRKIFWTCVGISTVLHAAIFIIFPSFDAEAYDKPQAPVIIQLEDIPETRQERRPPPPPRPVVPVATDSPDIPDDVTIETTDLDLDLDDLAPPPPMEEIVEEIEVEEEEEIVELWKVEQQPTVKKQVRPSYPEIARKANIEGRVFVLVLIGKDGRVEQVGEVTGPEVFHEAAKTAVRQTLFNPAIQNDKPVRVWASVPFTFKLK
ncbi:MAG: TonB family protein [Candidatus Latescibacteria bacterium]|nr:TonB family protein [Candidatus Latescibacterota bacterium]